MPTLGLPELLIIAVILVLVFGVGKLGDVGGALGRGIREFKHEVHTGKDETPKLEEGPDRKSF
ncbi:MAG: twin-arginine translocase TatA/TatE family subunit [Ardenticatenales bacterium]|nr:twin-arginine translocase TatA/TatE family subunit [Ardenticatenales bacterium]